MGIPLNLSLAFSQSFKSLQLGTSEDFHCSFLSLEIKTCKRSSLKQHNINMINTI